MILDASGGFYLVGGDGPSTFNASRPAHGGGAGLVVVPVGGGLLIRTLGADTQVDVMTVVLSGPFRQSGPFGWEARARGEVVFNGDVRLSDASGRPRGKRLRIEPGRYGVEVHGTSVEYMASRPGYVLDEGENPVERHMVYLWPADAADGLP